MRRLMILAALAAIPLAGCNGGTTKGPIYSDEPVNADNAVDPCSRPRGVQQKPLRDQLPCP